MTPLRPSKFDPHALLITQWCSEGLSLRHVARRLVQECGMAKVTGQALHYYCVTREIGTRRRSWVSQPTSTRVCDKCKNHRALPEFSFCSSESSELKTTCDICLKQARKTVRAESRVLIRDLVSQCKKQPCADCNGIFHPWAMEFDHRVPEQKRFLMAKADKQSLQKALEEATKCDVVCSNCHRVRTARRRQGLPATLPPPEYHI